MERAKIDNRLTQATALVGSSAARAFSDRGEFLRKPQQAEIVHLHLELGGFDAAARGNRERAMAIGRIDQNIDLGPDLAGKFAHRTAVGHVERNDFACGSSRNASSPENFFHGSASPIQISSAPAVASACAMAWPGAVLPSVTRTFRDRADRR